MAERLEITLIERMKTRRKLLGMTQTELAEACGVTQHTISRTETGKTSPSMRLLVRIFWTLGIELRIELTTPDTP